MEKMKLFLAVFSMISLICAAIPASQAQTADETEYFIQETLSQSPFYSHKEGYRFTFKVEDGILEQHASKLLLRINFKDVGRFNLTTDEIDRQTLRSRCGLKTNPKNRESWQDIFLLELSCRDGEKCVEDYWAHRDKMVRESDLDLYFCPTEAGLRDAKRVKNAIGHYMELLGIRVKRLDMGTIGSQFD